MNSEIRRAADSRDREYHSMPPGNQQTSRRQHLNNHQSIILIALLDFYHETSPCDKSAIRNEQ